MKCNRKYILSPILLLLLLSAVTVSGQTLKTADTYYSGGAYYSASSMYRELLIKQKDNRDVSSRRGDIMYRIAECYRRMNKIEESEKWYLQAEKAGYTDAQLYYSYGCVQLLQGRYAQARELFEKSRDAGLENRELLNLKIVSCEMSEVFGRSNTQHQVKPMENLNTRGSEYGLSFFEDNLIFASTGPGTARKAVSERTGLPYSSLYMASPDSRLMYGRVEKLETFSEERSNEGTFCYDAQNNQLYCTRCDNNDKNCYIMKVDVRDGYYKERGKLRLGNQTYGIGHPYITDDGNRIYFVSTMEGGQGGSDLWYVDRVDGGSYSAPVNLGTNINTAGEETFPSFIEGVLYFSSDGHAGLGGLDLFASYLETDGSFGEPFNLRSPFNSSWDDFNMVHHPDSKSGLFVSNRENASRSDDIYMFDNFPPHLIIYNGSVYDRRTDSALTDYTVSLTENGIKIFEQHVTGQNGYIVYLSPEHSYDIRVTAPEYAPGSETLSTVGMRNFQELSGKMYLGPVIEEKDTVITVDSSKFMMIEMKDIFYEFDKFRLVESSKRELDKYVEYFNQYPQMSVEISSHTDTRGSDGYNLRLSELRAKAVVDYFLSRGVSPGRLIWHGYGETRLVVPNAQNETEHQANRRTVFTILNMSVIGENVSVRHISAIEMLNSPEGVADMSGWWLQVHESGSSREMDLPAVHRAGALTGREVRLIRSDDGRYRYCIRYSTRDEALRSQILLYRENINSVLTQF